MLYQNPTKVVNILRVILSYDTKNNKATSLLFLRARAIVSSKIEPNQPELSVKIGDNVCYIYIYIPNYTLRHLLSVAEMRKTMKGKYKPVKIKIKSLHFSLS